MKTYEIEVTRGSRYWLVTVPELGYSTQARHLRELDEMTRDLISTVAGYPPDSFDLDINIQMPPEVSDHLDRAKKWREDAAHAQGEGAAEVRLAARRLQEDGIPLRDIGVLLNVSHQRASQLVNS